MARQPVLMGRSPASPLMLLYNNVAELRQFRGYETRMWPIGHPRSPAAAEHLNIEIADFLAQGVAVDPQQVGGPDLVAAGRRQRHRQQRVFDLAQHPVV